MRQRSDTQKTTSRRGLLHSEHETFGDIGQHAHMAHLHLPLHSYVTSSTHHTSSYPKSKKKTPSHRLMMKDFAS